MMSFIVLKEIILRRLNIILLNKLALIMIIFCGSHALADTSQINSAISNDTLMAILKPYYPLYNQTFKCHGVISGGHTYDDDQKDEFGYCVEIDRQIMVKTSKGMRLYVMVTGDLKFDGNGDRRLKGHALSGLAGMFILKPNGNRWQIESANPDISVEASGYGLHDWKLLKLGPEKLGFVNEHSDLHQGYFESGLIILLSVDNSIVESFINSEFSNAGTGRCGEGNLPACESIDVKIHSIDKSRVVGGYHPLKLVVNGNIDGKTYNNVIYTSYFDVGKGYQMPENYPLDRW